MGFSGRLEGIAPSDIFQIISQNRMTGTLIARCPDGTAMVVFKDGQVVEAASDVPHEALGHVLTARELVSEQTIAAALERRKLEPERQLGALLMEMGAITTKDLEAVVRGQIGNIVHRLMSCDDGFLTFDRGEVAVKRKLNTHEFFLPSGVSPEYLIMERARVIDEDRRRVIDRRAQDPAPSAGTWPAVERRRATGNSLKTAPPLLQSAAQTVLTATKQLAGAARDILQRSVFPLFKTAVSRVRVFPPVTGALIVGGAGGIATVTSLILLLSLSAPKTENDLVVTGRVVKLRATPATSAKVVAKIAQGEMVSQITFTEGWHQIRTKAGETGWIWKNLVKQQEKKGMTFNNLRTFFEVLLITGAGLIIAGIMRT